MVVWGAVCIHVNSCVEGIILCGKCSYVKGTFTCGGKEPPKWNSLLLDIYPEILAKYGEPGYLRQAFIDCRLSVDDRECALATKGLCRRTQGEFSHVIGHIVFSRDKDCYWGSLWRRWWWCYAIPNFCSVRIRQQTRITSATSLQQQSTMFYPNSFGRMRERFHGCLSVNSGAPFPHCIAASPKMSWVGGGDTP